MPKFYFINAYVPDETVRLLRESCEQRGIEFVEIDAITFDYEPSRCASPGDMLYCAGTTAASGFVEAHLYQPGVATFYSAADGLCLPQILQRAQPNWEIPSGSPNAQQRSK